MTIVSQCRITLPASLLLLSGRAWASGSPDDGLDWGMALFVLFLIVCIVGIIYLTRYVKRQQQNHVLPLIWMNSTLLKGRLLNMVVILEEATVLLERSGETGANACHLSVRVAVGMEADILDLIKRSDLGKRNRNKINGGFTHLKKALVCFERMSGGYSENDNKGELLFIYRSNILPAIALFEKVIPDIYE